MEHAKEDVCKVVRYNVVTDVQVHVPVRVRVLALAHLAVLAPHVVRVPHKAEVIMVAMVALILVPVLVVDHVQPAALLAVELLAQALAVAAVVVGAKEHAPEAVPVVPETVLVDVQVVQVLVPEDVRGVARQAVCNRAMGDAIIWLMLLCSISVFSQ